MSDVRQILFVHTGPRPRVNERLPIELGLMHPGAEVVSFDVFAAFRRRYPLLAMTAIEAVVRHWGDLATRRMRPKRAVMETTLFARFAEREIAHAIRRRSVDLIVQSQGFFPPVKADVPLVVYTDHAALVNRTYPVAGQISPVNRIFVDRERALFSAADLVLVRSRNVKHCIERDYGCSPERVRVVGIGPNIPVDDHRAVGSEHGGRIVFVGVDWQRKGGSDLLRAFTSVRSRHPEAELHIVGCRPSGIEGPGLVVHGLLSPTDTLDVLLRSDIFCLPTWQEPFGVAFVEAMLLGLPVVGTDLGAQPDFIIPGETGYRITPGDHGELAQILTLLTDDADLRHRLGANGRLLAFEHYTWAAVRERMGSEIDLMLQRREGDRQPPTDVRHDGRDAPR